MFPSPMSRIQHITDSMTSSHVPRRRDSDSEFKYELRVRCAESMSVIYFCADEDIGMGGFGVVGSRSER